MLPQNSKKLSTPRWPKYAEIQRPSIDNVREVEFRSLVGKKIVSVSRRFVDIMTCKCTKTLILDNMLRHLDKLAREEYNSTYEPVLYKLPPDTQF